MRLVRGFAGFLLAVCLYGSPAGALPDLETPIYRYDHAAPPASAFTQRHRDGAPTSDPPTPRDYFLFEPRQNDLTPVAEAPVIVYIHGAAPWPSPPTPTPTRIRSQIEHYVRSGFSVVWLMFCDESTPLAPCIDFEFHEQTALDSLEAALDELSLPSHVRPKLDALGRPEVVFVAHSVGTVMAARMAAKLGREQAVDPSVPAPAALILHDPAGYEQKVDLDVLDLHVHVDIRRTFPLEPPALDGLRLDTKLVPSS